MVLFGRKRGASTEPDVVAVSRLAQEALSARGIETVMQAPDDIETAALVEADGYRYVMYNLVRTCQAEPRERWADIVDAHLARLLSARAAVQPEDLSPTDLLAQVRTRIFASADVDFPKPGTLSYARPLADGLVIALCIDYPQTVVTINSATLAKLAVPVDDLFDRGQLNTDAEPVDSDEPGPNGVRILSGESLFVASRAANVEALLPLVGPAPQGLLFGLPNRHTLAYLIFRGEESLVGVNSLLRLTDGFTHDPEVFHPGGVLSGDVYYWAPDGRVERVGGRGQDGESLELRVSDAFADVFPGVA